MRKFVTATQISPGISSLFQMQADDVVLLASPLTFDPSVVDLFLALSSGAQVLIIPSVIKKMPRRLARLLFDDHKSTVLQVNVWKGFLPLWQDAGTLSQYCCDFFFFFPHRSHQHCSSGLGIASWNRKCCPLLRRCECWLLAERPAPRRHCSEPGGMRTTRPAFTTSMASLRCPAGPAATRYQSPCCKPMTSECILRRIICLVIKVSVDPKCPVACSSFQKDSGN